MLDVTKEVKILFENFKPKLPLINDIRNPALKKRHWDKIISLIGDNLRHHIEEKYEQLLSELK
jgi:dynein heavy chain